VGVQVDGDGDFVFESANQFGGGVRFEQAGHVFDAEDVGAHVFDFFGHGDVVFEGIFIPFFVEDVAGVAHADFGDFAGFHGFLEGDG